MESVVKTPNRDDFLKFIDETLTSKGFEKDPEKELWIRTSQIMVGGQVIIINGQRQENSGEPHTIKQCVEIFGDGDVKDTKTEVVNQFIEVNFTTYDNDIREDIVPTFCIYYDDQFLFKVLISKIFRI